MMYLEDAINHRDNKNKTKKNKRHQKQRLIMENIDFATLFQGFGTMMESGWLLSSARVFLIALGLAAHIPGMERRTGAYGHDSHGTGYGRH